MIVYDFEEVQRYALHDYYVHKRIMMENKIIWDIVKVCKNITQVYQLLQIKIDQPTKVQT